MTASDPGAVIATLREHLRVTREVLAAVLQDLDGSRHDGYVHVDDEAPEDDPAVSIAQAIDGAVSGILSRAHAELKRTGVTTRAQMGEQVLFPVPDSSFRVLGYCVACGRSAELNVDECCDRGCAFTPSVRLPARNERPGEFGEASPSGAYVARLEEALRRIRSESIGIGGTFAERCRMHVEEGLRGGAREAAVLKADCARDCPGMRTGSTEALKELRCVCRTGAHDYAFAAEDAARTLQPCALHAVWRDQQVAAAQLNTATPWAVSPKLSVGRAEYKSLWHVFREAAVAVEVFDRVVKRSEDLPTARQNTAVLDLAAAVEGHLKVLRDEAVAVPKDAPLIIADEVQKLPPQTEEQKVARRARVAKVARRRGNVWTLGRTPLHAEDGRCRSVWTRTYESGDSEVEVPLRCEKPAGHEGSHGFVAVLAADRTAVTWTDGDERPSVATQEHAEDGVKLDPDARVWVLATKGGDVVGVSLTGDEVFVQSRGLMRAGMTVERFECTLQLVRGTRGS